MPTHFKNLADIQQIQKISRHPKKISNLKLTQEMKEQTLGGGTSVRLGKEQKETLG